MSLAPQHNPEPCRVDDGGEAGRQRRPDMPERHHEGEVQRQIERDADHPDLHRRRCVAAREKSRGQHLDGDKRRQPQRIGGQRLGRQDCRLGVERATFKQNRNDRVGRNRQRQSRRKGQEKGVFQRPVERRDRRLALSGADLARQQRQQRRADGRADHAQRQLLDPVGVIEQRHRARRQQAGDDHVHRQIDLCHPGADQPGRHATEQYSNLRRQPRSRQADAHSGPAHRPNEQAKLGHA